VVGSPAVDWPQQEKFRAAAAEGAADTVQPCKACRLELLVRSSGRCNLGRAHTLVVSFMCVQVAQLTLSEQAALRQAETAASAQVGWGFKDYAVWDRWALRGVS
jgi:hypothetical protein